VLRNFRVFLGPGGFHGIKGLFVLGGSSYLVGGCSDAAFRCQQPNAGMLSRKSCPCKVSPVPNAFCLNCLTAAASACVKCIYSNTVYQSQYCDGIAYRDWSYASTAAAD